MVHREEVPSRSPTYGSLESPLNPNLQRSLESLGINSRKCGNNNKPLDEKVATLLLREVLYDPRHP